MEYDKLYKVAYINPEDDDLYCEEGIALRVSDTHVAVRFNNAQHHCNEAGRLDAAWFKFPSQHIHVTGETGYRSRQLLDEIQSSMNVGGVNTPLGVLC